MTGFPSDFEHQAIGESKRRFLPVMIQRRSDDLGILEGELLVIEEHLDGRGNSSVLKVVDSGQNPRRFREYDV